MEKYRVIGGQYYFIDYGGAETLQEARAKAEMNIEFWDNWQGFHTPNIYLTKDCTKHEDNNYQPKFFPKNGCFTQPYDFFNGKKWNKRKV